VDRIRRALDLAREERGEPAAAVRPAVDPAREATGRAELLPAGIRYSQTRVFHADPDALERARIFDPTSDSAAVDAFRMLRTQVLQRMRDKGMNTLGVVSAGPGEGKSFTAANLAVQLAADRRHTALLVDYDLARPVVAASFGLAPEFGVEDVLATDVAADVTSCLYHPEGFDRLVLLPARGQSAGARPIGGPRSFELIAELKARYRDRIVVFDLPPVLATDDAVAIAPHLDAVLVVVSEGRTRRGDLLRCMELMQRTIIVGTVLNRASDVPTGRR
jgi:protein-tyrosine kinase